MDMSNTWRIKDKEFTRYLSEDEIQSSIHGLAMRINQDYDGKLPLFIVILNGAFIFASDLLKKITIEC